MSEPNFLSSRQILLQPCRVQTQAKLTVCYHHLTPCDVDDAPHNSALEKKLVSAELYFDESTRLYSITNKKDLYCYIRQILRQSSTLKI